jgi:hypothetical protein
MPTEAAETVCQVVPGTVCAEALDGATGMALEANAPATANANVILYTLRSHLRMGHAGRHAE